MTFSFEFLLVLGVVGFYIYDSMVLLHINEFVLIHRNGRWSYVYPSADWQLLGKRPYVPNPFRPDAEIYIVKWPERRVKSRCAVKRVQLFGEKISFLRVSVRFLLLLMLIVLPLLLITYGSGPLLLLVFGTGYVTVVWALLLVYQRRKKLQLSNRQFAAIGFESLACLPFAINLLRKVTSRVGLIADPVEFARAKLGKDDFHRLLVDLLSRIDEYLEWLDDAKPGHSDLVTLRQRIVGFNQ